MEKRGSRKASPLTRLLHTYLSVYRFYDSSSSNRRFKAAISFLAIVFFDVTTFSENKRRTRRENRLVYLCAYNTTGSNWQVPRMCAWTWNRRLSSLNQSRLYAAERVSLQIILLQLQLVGISSPSSSFTYLSKSNFILILTSLSSKDERFRSSNALPSSWTCKPKKKERKLGHKNNCKKQMPNKSCSALQNNTTK